MRYSKRNAKVLSESEFAGKAMHSMETMAKRLKGLRRAVGYTQANVASDTGICDVTLSAYEKGKYTPDMVKLVILAEYWGVSIDWLCGREEE